MAITITANPVGNDTTIVNSLGGGGVKFIGSLNILSAVNNPGYARPLTVYSQPTLLPNPTVAPYPGALAAHYSLTSYNSFSVTNTNLTGGKHMTFFTTPTNPPAPAPGSYLTSPTTYYPAVQSDWANQPWAGGNISQPAGITGVSYATSSDYRLKENITPVENGLDYIMPLRPRRFTWKTTNDESIGFIAHELQEDLPIELSNITVNGTKDATKKIYCLLKDGEKILNVVGDPQLISEQEKELYEQSGENYSFEFVKEEEVIQTVGVRPLIGPLVAAVQQLKKIYDEQEQEISQLENRISLLKQRLI